MGFATFFGLFCGQRGQLAGVERVVKRQVNCRVFPRREQHRVGQHQAVQPLTPVGNHWRTRQNVINKRTNHARVHRIRLVRRDVRHRHIRLAETAFIFADEAVGRRIRSGQRQPSVFVDQLAARQGDFKPIGSGASPVQVMNVPVAPPAYST